MWEFEKSEFFVPNNQNFWIKLKFSQKYDSNLNRSESFRIYVYMYSFTAITS